MERARATTACHRDGGPATTAWRSAGTRGATASDRAATVLIARSLRASETPSPGLTRSSPPDWNSSPNERLSRACASTMKGTHENRGSLRTSAQRANAAPSSLDETMASGVLGDAFTPRAHDDRRAHGGCGGVDGRELSGPEATEDDHGAMMVRHCRRSCLFGTAASANGLGPPARSVARARL